MRFDLVIFDFDGVLGETVEVKTKAFYETALPYGEDAARKLVDYHRVHGGVSRVLKFEWLFREVLRKPLTPEILDSLCSRFASKVLERMFTEPMFRARGKRLRPFTEKCLCAWPRACRMRSCVLFWKNAASRDSFSPRTARRPPKRSWWRAACGKRASRPSGRSWLGTALRILRPP